MSVLKIDSNSGFGTTVYIDSSIVLSAGIVDCAMITGGQSFAYSFGAGVVESSTTLQYAPQTQGGVTLQVTYNKISDELWEKVFTLTATYPTSISLRSALTGTISTYYNYTGPMGNPIGGNNTQPYQSAGVVVTGQTEIVGMIADDGWSAKWCLGQAASSLDVSETFTNGLAITYGKSGSWQTLNITSTPTVFRLFIFKCPISTRDFQKYSQLYLAEGKGSNGTEVEKLAYATALACLRIQSISNQRVFAHPSYYYKSGQWVRDSFWTSIGVGDGPISYALLQNIVAATNWTEGRPPVFINDTNSSAGFWCEDEGTLILLIWDYYLFKFHEISNGLTEAQRLKLVERIGNRTDASYRFYSLSSGSPESDRIGLADSYSTQGQTVATCYNQGMYATALRCAYEMGVSTVTAQMIANAKAAYNGMYDSGLGYLRLMLRGSSWVNRLSPTDLIGEYYYNWFFKEKLLTTEIVAAQWGKLLTAETAYGMKYVSQGDGSYCNQNEWITGGGVCYEGHYQNGGSWIMADYCCHFVAYFHGLDTRANIVASFLSRFETEVAVSYNLHEYLAGKTNPSSTAGDAPVVTHVYGWNTKLLGSYTTFLYPETPTIDGEEVYNTTNSEVTLSGIYTFATSIVATLYGVDYTVTFANNQWSVTVPVNYGVNEISVLATNTEGSASLTITVNVSSPIATRYPNCPAFVKTETGFRACRVFQKVDGKFIRRNIKYGKLT